MKSIAGVLNSFKVNTSIRRFLLISILSFTTLYIGATYYISRDQAEHEIEELFDAQLAQSSYILLNLLGDSVATIDQSSKHLPVVYYGLNETRVADKNSLLYQKKVAYQVWNSQKKLLVKSGSAPASNFANFSEGFSSTVVATSDGSSENWRVFSLYDDDWDFWLHVAESESIREELAQGISGQTLKPGLLMLPLVLLSLIIIIRIGLKPLAQLAKSIKSREANNLSAIELGHAPSEIKPVVKSLNDLFTRLEDAIKREQRLTADAAHELRTPLAVIMIHAQNAINAHNDQDRNMALGELEKGVTRISRLLEQLLTLSKISPDTIPLEPLVFYPLCQDVLAQMAPKVLAKHQDMSMECASSVKTITLNGSAFLLEILIRNLIDNASQYSPTEGHLELSITQHHNHIILSVQDSGPGVPPDQIDKLTDRFYRQHQQTGHGAGLGLALVNSIVNFHGGELTFKVAQFGGLCVEVRLPIFKSDV
jgi:two-component system sensor histidine kinase QseC